MIFIVADQELNFYSQVLLLTLAQLRAKLGDGVQFDSLVELHAPVEQGEKIVMQRQRFAFHKRDFAQGTPTGPINPGQTSVLTDFLNLGLDDGHIAERYLLVMYGHNLGLRFGGFSNGKRMSDRLTVAEVAKSLKHFARQRGGKKLEVLGYDACTMALVESAFELRDAADYLVASQTAMRKDPWPYQSIFLRVNEKTSSDRPLDSEHLAGILLDVFKAAQAQPMTLSLLNLNPRRLDHVSQALNELAIVLLASVRDGNGDTIRRAFQDAQNAPTPLEPVVDLQALCTELIKADNGLADEVRQRAGALLDALTGKRTKVVKRKVQPRASSHKLKGVGIYAKSVKSEVGFAITHRDFGALGLSERTKWDELITVLARP